MRPWEVSLLVALAVLLVLLGAHAITRLSRQIRAWQGARLEKPWGRAFAEAFRFGVLWAIGAALAAIVSFPSHESDTMGAAGALLAIVGGLAFGSYAFALALVTVVGFFHLRPGGADAPWAGHALMTGLMVSVTWLALCPAPILLSGEAEPSAPHLAALLLGVVFYSLAVVAAVFWKTRMPLPAGEAAPAKPSTPRAGVQAVAVFSLLWALVIPAAAVSLYQRFRAGEGEVPNPVFDGWGVTLWLVPVVAIVGLHLRREWGRRLSLALFGFAVLVYGLFAVLLLIEEPVNLLVLVPLLLLFGWPLWYLNRPAIRSLFSPEEPDTTRT